MAHTLHLKVPEAIRKKLEPMVDSYVNTVVNRVSARGLSLCAMNHFLQNTQAWVYGLCKTRGG